MILRRCIIWNILLASALPKARGSQKTVLYYKHLITVVKFEKAFIVNFLLDYPELSWIALDCPGLFWIPPGFLLDSPWIPPGFPLDCPGLPWIALDSPGFPWIPLDWILLDSPRISLISLGSLGSLRLIGNIVSHFLRLWPQWMHKFLYN